MEIILQIFTGGYKEKNITYEQIEERLIPVLEKMPIAKVIIGWSIQPELYRKVKRRLEMYHVECFLWLPVFSETGLIKPVNNLIDFRGKPVKSYGLKEGENFEFYCSNNELNGRSFLEIYWENFESIDFDGVFLDKIRSGSFSNGLSGVFNCFCPYCIKQYEKSGISEKLLKKEMEKVAARSDGYGKVPLKIKKYENGRYSFEEEIWESFFKVKSENIYQALQPITSYFKSKGKKIGMDTFSPCMAYFAGQDFDRLKELTDFVKPMMYRITQAPAGLPFEYGNFISETTGKTENKKFDMDFARSEVDVIKAQGIPVYYGMEVNSIKGIAEADETYITETLEAVEQMNVAGVVLSWDLLSAPDENIAAVRQFFVGKGEN